MQWARRRAGTGGPQGIGDLVFESSDRLRRALHRFQGGTAGFADCMTDERGRELGCTRLVTFDRALLGLAGVVEP